MTSVHRRRVQAAAPGLSPERRALLARLVDRLVEALHPDSIFLFGSGARGDATEESDLDLLVILPDDGRSPHDATRRAYEATEEERRGVGLDIIVTTRERFAATAPARASLAATVLREGQRLYGRLPPRGREEDTAMAAAEEGRRWLASAAIDLRAVELSMRDDPPLLEIAVYHAQQTAEKALKAFLADRDQPLSKTHELPALLAACVVLDRDLARFQGAAERLRPYIYRFRYPPPPDHPDAPLHPTQAEAELALADARAIIELVRSKLTGA